MKEDIIIVGSGGMGKDVLWTINDCNKEFEKYNVLGFLDDNYTKHGDTIHKIPILGKLDWIEKNYKMKIKYCIAIGDSDIREKFVLKMKKYKIKFKTIIHPSVIKTNSIKVGNGTIIQAGCIIPLDVKIGKHVIININTTLGHDCEIKDYVTISPGVNINGKNTIGKNTLIGSGVSTIENTKIGKHSTIGIGSIVSEDVPDYCTYLGNPGRVIKKNKK